NHLLAEHDVTWALYDLIPVSIHNGNDRTEQTARDAPVVDVHVLPRSSVAAPLAGQAPAAVRIATAFFGFGSQRGQPAVFRINNQRRLFCRPSTLGPVRRRPHANSST